MTIKVALQRTIATAILTFLLSSCISDTILHQYQHISKYGWSRNDTVTFELPPANFEGRYSIDTEIRTACPFPYQKLWIIRELALHAPLQTKRDTICIETGNSGAFLEGKGVTMRSYCHRDTTIVLKDGQNGNIKLYHAMSREVMPYITDIGIKVRAIR